MRDERIRFFVYGALFAIVVAVTVAAALIALFLDNPWRWAYAGVALAAAIGARNLLGATRRP